MHKLFASKLPLALRGEACVIYPVGAKERCLMAAYNQSSSSARRSRGCGGYVLAFVVGILLGLLFFAFFVFASRTNAPIASHNVSANDTVVAQVSPTLLAQLLEKTIQTSGVPGSVKNVQVVLSQDGYMNITGDETVTLLGFTVTKNIAITVQPYTNNCQVQMHVISADFSGISVTGFVSSFEGQINQRLHIPTENLPQGFHYCITGVRTDPQGLFVTASVTPA